MIKGVLIGAVVMYFYLERPEDFLAVSEYIKNLYNQLSIWIQNKA